MKHLVLSALLLGAAAPAPASERSFPVGNFQRVLASGSEDVVITTGKPASVVASGADRDLDRLDIRVDGDTLVIGHKRGNWTDWSNDGVKVRVSVPTLHGVRSSGSGDISASSGTGPAFGISGSGSGDIRVDRIESPTVSIGTSGSGDVVATGRCTSVDVSISGSGDTDASALKCTDAEVKISGSGNVRINATARADIRISGSGDVIVTGGARCQSRASGSGDVYCP